MAYEIQKGVPVPPGNWNNRNAAPGGVLDTLRKMEVGDSFVVTGPEKNQAAAKMSLVAKQTGRKFTQRKTPEGHRVWRIE